MRFKMDNMCFSLRVAIRPDKHTKEDVEAVVEYAVLSGMDDVCMFIAGEEANDGFYTKEELEPWLEAGRMLKKATLEAGLTFSVNPWNTLLHGDRGRELKPGQNFTKMVDFHGKQASAVSCPMCPEFRKWLIWNYSTIAKELDPHILWVEDDFRIHNHSPLDWGGCFCKLHMDKYQTLAGEKFSRSDFYNSMLKPGVPHKYRKVWLDVHRETMVGLANMLGLAVHEVNPSIQVALMSSTPNSHNAEGRDWEGILRGLSGKKNTAINRIHLPAYSDTAPGTYQKNFNAVSMLVRALIPKDTLVMPELENFTFSRFIKSDTFMRFQIVGAAPLRLTGMTFDLFDVGGGGIFIDEHNPQVLKDVRNRVISLNRTGVLEAPPKGVQVLSSSKAAGYIHTLEGRRITELYPDEAFWSGLFGIMGIPFVHKVDIIPDSGVCAISGQFFRSCKVDEIKKLFDNCKLLMTGDAVDTLVDMGLGYLVGIKSIEKIEMNTAIASYEEVSDNTVVSGVQKAHCSAQVNSGDWYRIEYEDDIRIYSQVYNAKNQVQGSGMTLSANDRCAILPYGNFQANVTSHYHPVRQALLQNALKDLGQAIYIKNARNMSIYNYQLANDRIGLYVVNASLDGCEKLDMYLGDCEILKAEQLVEDSFEIINHDQNIIYANIPPLDAKLLVIQLKC